MPAGPWCGIILAELAARTDSAQAVAAQAVAAQAVAAQTGLPKQIGARCDKFVHSVPLVLDQRMVRYTIPNPDLEWKH
jgi:hypothetical protein